MKRLLQMISRWFKGKKKPVRRRRTVWGKLHMQPLEQRLVMAAELVADMRLSGGSDPQNLIVVGDNIYFTADDGQSGRELWRSNGSLGNAAMVTDIRVGPGSSNPQGFFAVGNTLYFTADDGQNGRELYAVSSGGSASLINIAGAPGVGSNPASFANVNGTLYFSADDGGTFGRELWFTTGGSANAIDIRPGSTGSFPVSLANVNGDLFFGANDGSNVGTELMILRSGTSTPTRVMDINPGQLGSDPANGANVANQYFFYATDGTDVANELWVSNGTSTGTRLVGDLNLDPYFNNGQSEVQQIIDYQGQAYFSAIGAVEGRELWVSATGASALVYNIVVGGDSDPAELTVVENTLFFSADTQGSATASERELFVIGTPGGPFTNLDLVTGTTGSNPQFLTNADGALYFAATGATGDREIWRSGGTSTNTVLDTNVKTSGSSNPTYLAYYNGFVYFSADGNSGGRELYRVPAVLPNFAPTLNNAGNPFLTAIAEDNLTNNGTDIATLIASSLPVVMITDADAGARQGIAITAADTTNGTWQFSLNDGASWSSFPTNLSDTNALLLAVDAVLNRIRFVPNADYFGTVTNAITFRAWDQFKTRGSEGLTVSTVPNGGSRPFSSATETASITVTPVGDLPVVTNAPTVPEDTFSSLFQVIPANIDGTSMTHFQVTGIPGTAQLTDSIGNPINNNEFITVATAAAGLRFQGAQDFSSPPAVNLTFRATPTGSTVGLGTPVNVPITVTPVADLPNVTYPTLVTPISTTEDTQTAAGGIRLNRSAVDGAEVTHFLISNITNGSIINPATGLPTSGSFSITYAQGQAGLVFVPAANYNGTATFQFQAATSALGAGASAPVAARIVVTAVNDAPVNTLPSSVIARINTPSIPSSFPFTGPNQISVADVDVSTGLMTVNLLLSGGGVLNVTGGGVSGNGTANISMTNVQLGTLNARLSTLVFTPTQNFTGTVTLTMTTSDGGNVGTGGTLLDTDTIVIDVQADNIAPVFTSIPGLQTFNEDTPRPFAPGNGNAIQISDADAGVLPLDVTLTSAVGTLFVSTTTGLTVTGNGSASLVLNGPQANLNAALNSLTFTPTLDYFGLGSIGVVVNDLGNRGFGGAQSVNGSIPLSITSVNDAPVNTIPAPPVIREGAQLIFDSDHGNQISISDVDLGTTAQIFVRLNAPNGKIGVQAVGGVVVSGLQTATVTLLGTIANVNQALRLVTYDANVGFTGNELLTITTNDLNTTLQGSGGARVDVDTVTVTILNINRPPVNTVPGTQATAEDQVLAFSTANGNAISITDVDAGLADISVVLSVTNGTVQLGSTAGLTTVTGNNSSNLTILGDAAVIATALDTLTFTPTLNYFGTASIVIAADDLGNSGEIDPLRGTTDQDTVLINISSVNDAPVQIIPATQDTGLNTPVVFNSTNANLIQVTDVDAADDQLRVNLSVTNGRLTLGDDRFLGSLTGNSTSSLQFTGNLASLNFAMAGMVFTPDVGFIGDAVVTMTTNDQTTTGGAARTDSDTMVIRVRNLIEISGNTMFVTGTNGNDVMSLVFSSTTAYTVNINGSTQTGNTSTVNNIRFAGGLGNDTLTITDSSLASSAVFTPFGLQMTSSGYTVNALTTETIIVGGSATDTATFNDSAGDDTVNVAPTVSFMTGAGGFRNQVNSFGKVTANASTGNDRANLTDGNGDDKFTAFPTYAVFTGPGVDYFVSGFDQVAATGTNGTDTAIFVDSAGNDVYTARPTLATLQGTGYLNSAANFDKTYAFVAAGNTSGNDQAFFFDSAGNDIFYGVQTYSIMYSAAYYNQATGFDNCVATATLGVDNAVMFDTTANDIVLADSTFMRLTAATLGISYEARGFDQATVFSNRGGTDKATFNDSAGVDKYYGLITHSAMVGPGYFIQAYGFADVRAVSSRGGNDVAILYGSTGNDTLTGAGSAAQVRYQNNRITGVSGFRTVQAIANRTGTDRDRRSIGAITYSLQVYGNWPF